MEKWKPVKGFLGSYEVSTHGRVRSLPRVIIRSNGSPQTVRGRVLKCEPFGKLGYVQVNLSDRTSGNHQVVFVHVLVAETFLKKPKGTDRVCHKDDDGSNNRVRNLYWGTASTNGKDSYRNGRQPVRDYKGSRVYNAIQDSQVRQVLKLRRHGFYPREICDAENLNWTTVQAICAYSGRFAQAKTWNL